METIYDVGNSYSILFSKIDQLPINYSLMMTSCQNSVKQGEEGLENST